MLTDTKKKEYEIMLEKLSKMEDESREKMLKNLGYKKKIKKNIIIYKKGDNVITIEQMY